MSRRVHEVQKHVSSDTGSFRKVVEGTLPVEKYVQRLDERVRERHRDEERPWLGTLRPRTRVTASCE